MGRDKVGGWRWEWCLRLVLMPDASWWPLRICLILGVFKPLNPHFWPCVLFQFDFPMERAGGEDAASGGWLQARPSATWGRAALALLIYQPQWFTVIDVHIPECQNNLCLKRNQWHRLWFYLRPFPDKWLNCAWSWENTAEEQGSVLASVCVERLGKGHLCVGLTFPLWVPWSLWGVPQLCQLWEDSGLMTALFWCFFRAFLPSPDVGTWCSVLDSTILRNANTVINHCAFDSLSCETEVKLPVTGIFRTENVSLLRTWCF